MKNVRFLTVCEQLKTFVRFEPRALSTQTIIFFLRDAKNVRRVKRLQQTTEIHTTYNGDLHSRIVQLCAQRFICSADKTIAIPKRVGGVWEGVRACGPLVDGERLDLSETCSLFNTAIGICTVVLARYIV